MTVHDTLPPKPPLNNVTLRILTGVTLIPLVLMLTFVGGWVLLLALMAVVGIGMLEFYHMEQQRYDGGNMALGMVCGVGVLLGFYFMSSALIVTVFAMGALLTFVVEMLRSRSLPRSLFRIVTTLGGVVYLAVPAGCLLVIRAIPNDGLWWVYTLYLATWGNDTMAYFIGRQFGRTPLAPRLSPKKTVEGAVGGIVGGIVFPLLLLLLAHLESLSVLVLLLLAPFVGIWGDLFESALKRYFGLKDSGLRGLNLFPGHGGVLDRIDSLVSVTALFYLYLVVMGRAGF